MKKLYSSKYYKLDFRDWLITEDGIWYCNNSDCPCWDKEDISNLKSKGISLRKIKFIERIEITDDGISLIKGIVLGTLVTLLVTYLI